MQKSYGMSVGVYVGEVSKNSPVEKAGIENADILISFNGRVVKTMAQLQELLSNRKAGETVDVVVSRLVNGTYVEKTLTVTLGSKAQANN
ncbi:MAG TPA: PDZ domain-containing protein [Lachnospiraceae bacterium]|nr:PDZ domain-containing protein [Lachnospiraceae bacterium]